MQRRYGLLGEKLSHSYSPELHALFGDYSYELIEIAPGDLGDFLRARNFYGLNVTIPYKTTVMAVCDQLSEAAEAIGSVNTVVKRPDGSLYGDNTDAAGFEGMVWKSRIPIRDRKCLVLGSGGASLSVQYVLEKQGAKEIVVVSRSGANNYGNLDRHRDAQVIVNTTPVGMYPNTSAALIDLRKFPQCQGILDLIYNPARTVLLQQAEALDIPHLGGMFMLVEQARYAAQIFTGSTFPSIRAEGAYHTLCHRKENRVLIGMPGCGKSTIGRELAKLLDHPFIDCDQKLEEHFGVSCADFINRQGVRLPGRGNRPPVRPGEGIGAGDLHRGRLRHPGGELSPAPPERHHHFPGTGAVQAAQEGPSPVPPGQLAGYVHHAPAQVPPLRGPDCPQRRGPGAGGQERGGGL